MAAKPISSVIASVNAAAAAAADADADAWSEQVLKKQI